MIQGECPVCRRVFKVADRFAGMTGHCKACGATIRVPGELDEGLDVLPAPPGAAAPSEQAPPATAPAPPEGPPPEPAPEPPPPSPSEPAAAGEPERPLGEVEPHRDARDRFEPAEGPTPLKGSWLKGEEPQPEPAAPHEPEPPAPQPARAVLSERFITPPAPEPGVGEHRPRLVVIACAAVCLLAIGFALHFCTAGRWGAVAAGIALALAGLAVVEMWMARWEGLLAGLFLCLCVAGAARVDPQAALANRVLLGAAALVLLLLLVAVLRRAVRDYFTT